MLVIRHSSHSLDQTLKLKPKHILIVSFQKHCGGVQSQNKSCITIQIYRDLNVYLMSSCMSVLPQEKATKWKNPDGHMDGLTTNGVLVMHPEGFPEDPKQGLWREISVCGDVYALRETRSGPSRGKLVSHSWYGYHVYVAFLGWLYEVYFWFDSKHVCPCVSLSAGGG